MAAIEPVRAAADERAGMAAHDGRARCALVIACGALAREIVALRRANGWDRLDIRCLPAELHNRPRAIPDAVRGAIRAHRDRYASIFVAYGDCGTGRELQLSRSSQQRAADCGRGRGSEWGRPFVSGRQASRARQESFSRTVRPP